MAFFNVHKVSWCQRKSDCNVKKGRWPFSPNFAVKVTQVIEMTGIGLSALSTRRPNQPPSD